MPPRNSRQRSCGPRANSNVTTVAVGAMLLDLPAVVDRDGEVVPPAIARAGDQRAHVRLRAAAVVVDDVQHAAPGRLRHREAHGRRFAQRPHRIGRDVRVHHVEVVRMPLEQQRHVARAELGLLSREGASAGMHDERVVGEHVAPARARGAQAQVVLLAVAQAERHVERPDRVEQRAPHEHAEAHAGGHVGIGGDGSGGDRGAHGLRDRRPPATRCSRRSAGTSRSPRCSRTA